MAFDVPSGVTPPLSDEATNPYSPGEVAALEVRLSAPFATPIMRHSSPPATWAPGAIIPGTFYRVIRPIGAGGMGEVYEAEHELLGVRRALKVLSRRLANREDLTERLRVEARALAGLRHPNLVEVSDLGVSSDGRVFFAMELLSGLTLRELLHRTGRLRSDQAIMIAVQVLDALGAAHETGMIHRDVKPENVFILRTGSVKLLDFGVAKALQSSSGPALTAAGVAIGTPRYMSPEQAEGKPIDTRSDIYAVGVLLWEMLVGRPPFHQLDAVAAAVAAINRGLPDVEEMGVTGLAPEVRAALRKATARLPADRHGSAAALAVDLRMAKARGEPVPSVNEKVTARYEDASTALVPILAELGVADPSDTDAPDFMTTNLGSGTPFGASALVRQHTMDVRTSELSVLPEPTEEALELRASLPQLDPRNLPTPTSLPPLPPVASAGPVTPVNSATSVAPPPPARVVWGVVPVAMALSSALTWWAVRPAPVTAAAPAMVVVAAVASGAASGSGGEPAAPPQGAAVTVTPAASTEGTAAASASGAPTTSGPVVAGNTGKKAAPARKPAPAAPATPTSKSGRKPLSLPGSGL
jgi:serine/threonine-protein kinase